MTLPAPCVPPWCPHWAALAVNTSERHWLPAACGDSELGWYPLRSPARLPAGRADSASSCQQQTCHCSTWSSGGLFGFGFFSLQEKQPIWHSVSCIAPPVEVNNCNESSNLLTPSEAAKQRISKESRALERSSREVSAIGFQIPGPLSAHGCSG